MQRQNAFVVGVILPAYTQPIQQPTNPMQSNSLFARIRKSRIRNAFSYQIVKNSEAAIRFSVDMRKRIDIQKLICRWTEVIQD